MQFFRSPKKKKIPKNGKENWKKKKWNVENKEKEKKWMKDEDS